MSSDILLKSFGWSTGSKIINMSLSLLSVPLFANLLTTQEYGVYTIYVMIQSLLMPIINLALPLCITRAKEEFSERYREFVFFVSMLLLVFSIPAIFIILNTPLLNILSLNSNVPLSLCGFLLFGIVSKSLIDIYSEFLRTSYNYKSLSVILVTSQLLSIALSYFIINLPYDFGNDMGRVFGIFITDLVFALVSLFMLFNKIRLNTFSFINIKNYIGYAVPFSLPLILSGIGLTINSQIDRIMINKYLSLSYTGIYGYLYSLSSLVFIFSALIHQTITPWLYSNFYDKFRRRLLSKVCLYLVAFAVVFSTIFLPYLIDFISPKEYISNLDICVYILLSGFFQFCFVLESTSQMFFKKTNINALMIFIGALSNIFLNSILIQSIGLKGAVIATLFTNVLLFILCTFYNKFILTSLFNDSKTLKFTSMIMFVYISILAFFGQGYLSLIYAIGACLTFSYLVYVNTNSFRKSEVEI